VADLSGVLAIVFKMPGGQLWAAEADFFENIFSKRRFKTAKKPELERLSCHLEGKDYGRLWSGMRVLSGG